MMLPTDRSLATALAALPETERRSFYDSLSTDEAKLLEFEWRHFWAREKQLPPADHWLIWLILAGRGFGKTRTGAEFVRYCVMERGYRRVALVARTAADARDVMVEGESGLLSVFPEWERPVYEPSKRRVTFANGAIATTYSGDKPDQLRGPQHDLAWADELAAWRYAESWDQLLFGLRLGPQPLAVGTTTPRPTKLIRELVSDPDVAVTVGTTYENASNLPVSVLNNFRKKYEGTRLGRQELLAKILTDTPGALWTQQIVDDHRVGVVPDLKRVVVAVDPAVTATDESDETGIVVAGIGMNNEGYVLADMTLRSSPGTWAKQALAALHRYDGDRIIGEVNNGGDMVEHTIRTEDRRAPYKEVRASRGKLTRAEPISALYEQGRVHHVGVFSELEDQMTTWVPGEKSPDRMDALVWALTELMLKPGGDGPRKGRLKGRRNVPKALRQGRR
jgi:phage terminase large subunit-like protein